MVSHEILPKQKQRPCESIQFEKNPEEWLSFQQILNFDQQILKQRWITLINPLSKTGNWQPAEDELIMNQMKIKNNRHIWTQIAILLYDQNQGENVRTPKQIRERWFNYLNPALKKTYWQMNEDLVILQAIVSIGKKWSQISNMLDGRTENQVKNRYKSLQNKIVKDSDANEIASIKAYIKKHSQNQIQNLKGGNKYRKINKKQIDLQQSVESDLSSDESYRQNKIRTDKIKISNKEMVLRSESLYNNDQIVEIEFKKKRKSKKNVSENTQIEKEENQFDNRTYINAHNQNDLMVEEHFQQIQQKIDEFQKPLESKFPFLISTDHLLDLEGGRKIPFSPYYQNEEKKQKNILESFTSGLPENQLISKSFRDISPNDKNQNGIQSLQFNSDIQFNMNPQNNDFFNFENPILSWNEKRNITAVNNNLIKK